MTTERLQNAIHTQPFRPFALRLADGRSLHVAHPDFIAHKPGGRTAIVVREDESHDVVDLPLVVSLEDGTPATTDAR
jgi:hypothetical protein